jgi:hypothetical protein
MDAQQKFSDSACNHMLPQREPIGVFLQLLSNAVLGARVVGIANAATRLVIYYSIVAVTSWLQEMQPRKASTRRHERR